MGNMLKKTHIIMGTNNIYTKIVYMTMICPGFKTRNLGQRCVLNEQNGHLFRIFNPFAAPASPISGPEKCTHGPANYHWWDDFCRDKSFVATNVCFSRQNTSFVATKVCLFCRD